MAEKKTKLDYKNIFRFIGYFIAAVSFFYIFWVGYKQWQNVRELFKFSEKWPSILIAAIIYTILIGLITSTVWDKLIIGFGGKITFKESFVISGRAQIAKYIPSNIFQYFARHLLSKNIGIPNGVIINSLFIETVLFTLSSVIIFIISAIVYGYKNFLFEGFDKLIVFTMIILTIIVVIAFLIFISTKFAPGIKEKLLRHNLIVNLETLDLKKLSFYIIICLILLMIFFLSTGTVIWFLNKYLWNETSNSILFFIGAYAIAWVAGFITPGASGGIGVREAILVALLAPYTNQAKALVLVIVFRLVTIIGDLLFFLITYIFKTKYKSIQFS